MFEFTEEQAMAQQMLRRWCEKELAPHVPAMEKGELLPYELGRKLWRTFGADEMARARFQKMEEREAAGDTGRSDSGPFAGDAGTSAILAMEVSRVCPGFMLAVGATVGLAGGAIMTKGS